MKLMKAMSFGRSLGADASCIQQMINRVDNPYGESETRNAIDQHIHLKDFSKKQGTTHGSQRNINAENI